MYYLSQINPNKAIINLDINSTDKFNLGKGIIG